MHEVTHLPYADLPRVGGVLGPAEPDRMRRLVAWLCAPRAVTLCMITGGVQGEGFQLLDRWSSIALHRTL